MTLALQNIITAARTLSARDKLELLQAISADLQQDYNFAEATTQFWGQHSITDILNSQTGMVVTDITLLAANFWPTDESADDINEFVAAQRKADRLR
jgi:hypothetical protein